MNRNMRTMLACVCLTLAAAGCSETPTEDNSIGGALTRSSFLIRDTTLYATSGRSFQRTLANNGAANLVGMAGGHTAYAVLQFPPSVMPINDTDDVLSATLRIRFVSWFGDSAGPFGISVHRIVSASTWSPDSLVWQDVQSDFYDPTPLGAEQFFPVQGDTETVSIMLDTTLIHSWFHAGNTGNPDSVDRGIILLPTSGTQVVRGFNAFFFNTDSVQYYPTLQVAVHHPAIDSTETLTIQAGFDTHVAHLENFTPNPDRLYTQAGIVYESRLTFDLGFIVRGTIISNAELVLINDPAETMIATPATRIVTVHRSLSETDSASFSFSSIDGIPTDGQPERYSFNVGALVQSLVRGPNYGITLRPSPATITSSLDRFAFYNATVADSTLRPRLRILYTVEQE